MKRLSPRKLTAVMAGVALLGLAVVALNQARRPALVVTEDDARHAAMVDRSQPSGSANQDKMFASEVDVGNSASAFATPEPAEDGIIVHVAGEVASPGVYVLPNGARVVDALEAAGGGTPESDTNMINLALPIHDGQQIYIPPKQSQPSLLQEADVPSNRVDITMSSPADGLININTASAAELEELPGVGPAIAARIVEHRQKHGSYSSVSDLLGVSGIGEAKLSKIAPYATVR
jgi:competence protein ComEA